MDDPVSAELARARERLLDPTMRNRLLNFRPTRRTTVQIVDELPARHSDLLLQTPLTGEDLQTNLLRIERQARSFLEERGVNLLFLAAGFLQWRGPEQADYHLAADLTNQANHLGVTLQADIVKRKLPETNRGFEALKFGKTRPEVYEQLTPGDHPIELTRYQVAGCYVGRVPLINSGGASGKDDFAQAVRTVVLNKRAGGLGLISGRKAFQRPMEEGVKLLNLIQDVYLDESITPA
jgi:DhnA family fructose-bisphosphate aldolase class Ia